MTASGSWKAHKDGKEIVYCLKEGHGLVPGQAVAVAIDWLRRNRLMRLHFAAELILVLTTKHLAGIEKIGAHIAEDKARIDFAWPDDIAKHLALLAAEAERIVDADLAVESAFSDVAAGRRYWKIVGFARVPCGGTHIKRSGEVGRLTLKRKNLGKGKERIEIALADGSP
ncbi:MAG: alanyl-tRNA editing protein [Kiloniellales bacterium]